MILSDLPDCVILLIADNLGPTDWISLMTTANRFHNSLEAKLHSVALTHSCSRGKSVLAWAAINGREALFRSLLERGAAVSNQDDDGNTVLHCLAAGGSIQLVCLLLEKDIDVDVLNKKNETALLCAVQNGHEDVVRELLKARANPAISITPGPEDEARRLLRAKIHANNTTRARGGRTRGFNVKLYGEAFKKPLHFAAEQGDGGIVGLLLKVNVDVSCTTFSTQSALHYAAIGRHKSVFEQLLKAGIDASIKDSFGMTAHHYASTYVVISHDQCRRVDSTVAEMMPSSSMALMPGPLVSPLSSSLSAVGADSLRKGVESPSARAAQEPEKGAETERPPKRARNGKSNSLASNPAF